MRLIVKKEVDEVGWLVLPDRSHIPHMHDQRPVSIHTDHIARWLPQGDPERNGCGVPHGAHTEEVPTMPVSSLHTDLIELTGGEASGCHKYLVFIEGVDDLL